MSWKSKVLSETDYRTSKVESITKPNTRGYVTVEFDNADVGQVDAEEFPYKVGDKVSYKLSNVEWSSAGKKSFKVTNITVEAENSSTKLAIKPLKVLNGKIPSKMLILDIETVRNQKTLNSKTDEFESWKYKRRKYEETTVKDLQESYKTDAALYSEFSKVVCVSIGVIGEDAVVTNSYYGTEEKDFLPKVSEILDKFCKKGFTLAGLGLKGYDIPFLMRRMLINRVPIPDCIDVGGMKPWEVDLVDIGEIWKSTGFYSASLLNIATAFGLPSPKQSIEGSEVSDIFYKSKEGLMEIVEYCEGDVFATANILLAMFGENFTTNLVSKTFGDGSSN